MVFSAGQPIWADCWWRSQSVEYPEFVRVKNFFRTEELYEGTLSRCYCCCLSVSVSALALRLKTFKLVSLLESVMHAIAKLHMNVPLLGSAWVDYYLQPSSFSWTIPSVRFTFFTHREYPSSQIHFYLYARHCSYTFGIGCGWSWHFANMMFL